MKNSKTKIAIIIFSLIEFVLLLSCAFGIGYLNFRLNEVKKTADHAEARWDAYISPASDDQKATFEKETQKYIKK